jgi:hypothetical protein
MKQFLLTCIRFYQKHLNLDNPIMKSLFLTDSACRYAPTCSEYMYQAIKKFGIIRGLNLGIRRILRCHPWNKGGFDPIPKLN